MNSERHPGQVLKELLQENGTQLAYDADRTEPLLRAAFPQTTLELEALLAAERLSIPWEILNSVNELTPEAVSKFAISLQESTEMPPELAVWAVKTWMFALELPVPEGAPPKPEASQDAKYFVLDGKQRYGPANIDQLNLWAAEGRISGGMLFEDAETGKQFTLPEIPGLFLPHSPGLAGTGVSSNYYRTLPIPEQGALSRRVDMALLKALVVLFLFWPLGVPSIILAALARTAFTGQHLDVAESRVRAANALSNMGFALFGLAMLALWSFFRT